MKYIDAERPRAVIKNLEEEARKIRVAKESTMNERIGADGQVKLCQKLQLLIDQFQQEQSVETEAYDPYKTTVESILKMFDSYSITTDKADFIANIRVKCKDAVEYATGKRPVEVEEKEVDLWKEIHRYFNPHEMELQFDRSKGNTILKPEQLFDFARHFAEWGATHVKK